MSIESSIQESFDIRNNGLNVQYADFIRFCILLKENKSEHPDENFVFLEQDILAIKYMCIGNEYICQLFTRIKNCILKNEPLFLFSSKDAWLCHNITWFFRKAMIPKESDKIEILFDDDDLKKYGNPMKVYEAHKLGKKFLKRTYYKNKWNFKKFKPNKDIKINFCETIASMNNINIHQMNYVLPHRYDILEYVKKDSIETE